MQKHEWRDEEGEEMTIWRAEYHASRWKVMSRLKSEEDWTRYEPIPLEVWKKLREVLWNKYQRNRCPHKFIVAIDKIIENDGKVDNKW